MEHYISNFVTLAGSFNLSLNHSEPKWLAPGHGGYFREAVNPTVDICQNQVLDSIAGFFYPI